MNLILNTPIEVRLGLLFVIGALVGGQLNRAIYRLAWIPREISPWGPAPSDVSARRWPDRLPVVGWWALRRETASHGRYFWVRPMLLELATGLGFAALYWLEVQRLGLYPKSLDVPPPDTLVVHLQFFSHIILISLMIVATFIDFDEQTIPDEITVPGTIIGLLIAIGLPTAALPTLFESGLGDTSVHHLVLTSTGASNTWQAGLGGPFSWPASFNSGIGLSIALVGIWGWCFAIVHRTWTLRHGVVKALQYMTASVLRRGTWRVPFVIGVCLTLVALPVWWSGTERWQALLSAIVGMCFGGGLIWVVRIVGGHALRMEAMGFGDVTLMAMIGAFLGWQPAFLIFFLAPFTALFIAAAQRIFAGQRHIAFGPFLCVSTLIVVLAWDTIWTGWASPMFVFGWFIPALLAFCLPLMGGLLWFWRMVRDAFF